MGNQPRFGGSGKIGWARLTETTTSRQARKLKFGMQPSFIPTRRNIKKEKIWGQPQKDEIDWGKWKYV